MSTTKTLFTNYFDSIPDIRYEGVESDNPLAFKHYNPEQLVLGKTMKEWCRFAVCYWHTMRGVAADPFGPGTLHRPWEGPQDNLDNALKRTEVFFDILTKLGVDYYCFHDRDVAPEGKNVAETNENLWAVATKFKELQTATGVKLLWGTANMFSHPRFNQGASTTCNADVYAYCANSVKEMLDITKYLNGENYVFWGGREGYMSLLNTDIGRELDHCGRFLTMAKEYADKIGFTGQFLIEPKPCEPSKHQYDFDTATVLGFLRKYGLEQHFKINIEANHATLAGHEFCHELEVARINDALGSIDANRGDYQNGWDTDQFPNDVMELTQAWQTIIKQGGIAPGGLNFDAKVRRDSTDIEDIFYAHIGGMDCFAKALKVAAQIKTDGLFDQFVAQRYSSFDKGIGASVEDGSADLESLQAYIVKKGEPEANQSARQEYLENLLNSYL